ncbi:MAG: FeoA family protein [Phycisphaerales bacterium]
MGKRKRTDRWGRQDGEPAKDADRRIPLTQLRAGEQARICGADGLEPCDQFLLETLGLGPDTCVRVCRASGSCILEVGGEHGQTSRIALARAIADKVIVGPLKQPPPPPNDSKGA